MQIGNIINSVINLFYKEDHWLVMTFWNSLFIAFFLLPLGINLPTPFFIISIVLGIVNIFRFKQELFPDNKALLLFPLYFIIMSFSLIYTENISDGFNLLQRSLSLLFFPIIFLFVKEDASSVKKLFDFLLLGLIVSFFINLSMALYEVFYIIKENITFFDTSLEWVSIVFDAFIEAWHHFITTEFSKSVNPSYISLYILLVLSYYLKNKLESKTQLLVIIVLFVYLFLLASRAAYLILAIMSLLLIFNITDKSKKYTMAILFFLGVLVFLNNPHVFDFYANGEDFRKTLETDNTAVEQSRLLTWNASFKLIQEAPVLGYGLGDTNEVLIEKYKELNYVHNFQNRYNAHNQFLQTYLQSGIIGFGVLVSIFVLLAVRMKRSRNEFSVFLILFISLLFESMLVRFNGIVFFSIVIPLLLKKRSILSSRIIRNEPTMKNNT